MVRFLFRHIFRHANRMFMVLLVLFVLYFCVGHTSTTLSVTLLGFIYCCHTSTTLSVTVLVLLGVAEPISFSLTFRTSLSMAEPTLLNVVIPTLLSVTIPHLCPFGGEFFLAVVSSFIFIILLAFYQ